MPFQRWENRGLEKRKISYSITELVHGGGGVRIHTWSTHYTQSLSLHPVWLPGCPPEKSVGYSVS